jgi:hypothetical protein
MKDATAHSAAVDAVDPASAAPAVSAAWQERVGQCPMHDSQQSVQLTQVQCLVGA